MTRLLILALLLAPLFASAQSIFRTTDEHGNVIFSDTPPANAKESERVELQPINTTKPPPQQPEPAPPAAAESEEAISYAVRIADPADQTSFPMGPGNFSVSARVEPDLDEADSLQLFIDGIPWGDPQPSASWNLTNIYRGQHDLTVTVIDSNGQALATSDPIRVFVHRPSINFRNR